MTPYLQHLHQSSPHPVYLHATELQQLLNSLQSSIDVMHLRHHLGWHDSTLSQINKVAPHLPWLVLPYFLQFSLLRVFSVNISTRGACDKQKTSPRISASFLLSLKRTPGGSVANPLHRCLERLPPACPQRKMLHQFMALLFFHEWICLSSIRCD